MGLCPPVDQRTKHSNKSITPKTAVCSRTKQFQAEHCIFRSLAFQRPLWSGVNRHTSWAHALANELVDDVLLPVR
eukprot:2874306-Alexandrium_andersonii.AAC.1